MTLERGLEVVVPRGYDRAEVPGLVEGKAAWVARTEARLSRERARLAEERAAGPPLAIELPALGERWLVEYRETGSSRVTVRERRAPVVAEDAPGSPGPPGAGLLRVSGAVADAEACRAALRRWLARRAAAELPPLLLQMAREEGLRYASVAVRGQRTRWGSCSRRGVVSLNRHLLFLPPELARYVLLHELCHTVRPDHSRGFWAEVRRREPAVERLRKELREAGRYVPGWAREPRGAPSPR